jgi:hypothetical protein
MFNTLKGLSLAARTDGSQVMSAFLIYAGAALTLAVGAAQLNAEVAVYRLDVNNTWSTETHPGRFPTTAAHFSWLGGGTHNGQVTFWQEGELASPGMVEMAETGVIDMLAGEIDANSNAFGSLTWRWWFCPEEVTVNSCGPLTVEFQVDSDFPLVTLATMLGPSPDWFVGVSGMPLRENDRWLEEVVVDLYPYDGGTRSANVWKLFGPQNNPSELIRLITDPDEYLVGTAKMGTMTFTLISPRPTAVVEYRTDSEPEDFALEQNFPNPFNSETLIRLALPASGEVELAVYNLVGQKMATLVRGTRQAGAYTVHWDGTDDQGRALATGVYLYHLRAGQQKETRRLLLIR